MINPYFNEVQKIPSIDTPSTLHSKLLYLGRKEPAGISPKNGATGQSEFCYGLQPWGPLLYFNAKKKGERIPDNFLSGLSTGNYTLLLPGQISMAGVIFKGTAFMDLFSLPNTSEYQDDRIDLGDIIGPTAKQIGEQLALSKSELEKVSVLENFFLSQLRYLSAKVNPADMATDIILKTRGLLRMDHLAGSVYLSPRQLRRRFKDRMGINPKYFARIKRFNYLNYSLTYRPELLPDLFAATGSFYDQSHFIRDFKEFFNATPNAQIKMNHKLAQILQTK